MTLSIGTCLNHTASDILFHDCHKQCQRKQMITIRILSRSLNYVLIGLVGRPSFGRERAYKKLFFRLWNQPIRVLVSKTTYNFPIYCAEKKT